MMKEGILDFLEVPGRGEIIIREISSEKMEGYKEGAVVEVFPVIQVHKNKNGIYDLNVKTKGWASKEECIKLTKQGSLDLIVCHSAQGHEYLRARMGSSINVSLDKLVTIQPI